MRKSHPSRLNSSSIVANDYDSRTHQAYFLASLKTRFPRLTFTEQKVLPEKKDTTVLTISNPANDLLGINVTLYKDTISIEVSGIHFVKRYNPSTIPTIAPDADPRIPPRLQALDFIQEIIEDKVFFRCYKHKGRIIRTEIVNLLSENILESKTYTIRGSFIKLSSNYDVTDYLWSKKKMQGL